MECTQCNGSRCRPRVRHHAFAHLIGRAIGERDRHDVGRIDLQAIDQMCDAVHDRACLARARTRKNEQRPLGVLHRGTLLRIQTSEMSG